MFDYRTYVRENYIDQLALSGDLEQAKEKLEQEDFSPLFKVRPTHPEAIPHIKNHNEMLLECINDLAILHHEFLITASTVKNLANNVETRLNICHEKLLKEKELRNDLQMFTKVYTDFEDLIVVDDYISTQNCSYSKGTFYPSCKSKEKIEYDIEYLIGNGQKGNRYILNDEDKFLEPIRPTAHERAIKDKDLQTFLEYQRIYLSGDETEYPSDMSSEHSPVECSIKLNAKKPFTEVVIHSDDKDLVLSMLEYSVNDKLFNSVIKKPIILNHDKDDQENYINHSGHLGLPTANHVQIMLTSTRYTDEKIGFMKKVFEKSEDESNLNSKDTLVKLPSAKRYCIRLNEIELLKPVYYTNSFFTTENLLKVPVKAVALYAKIYVPEYVQNKKCIDFKLIVNGTEYPIIPINSHLEGIKVIKVSEIEAANYSSVISDKIITDVRLKVFFNNANDFDYVAVSHLRLITGEAEA